MSLYWPLAVHSSQAEDARHFDSDVGISPPFCTNSQPNSPSGHSPGTELECARQSLLPASGVENDTLGTRDINVDASYVRSMYSIIKRSSGSSPQPNVIIPFPLSYYVRHRSIVSPRHFAHGQVAPCIKQFVI